MENNLINSNKIVDLKLNQNQKSYQEISFEGHVPNHLIEQYNQIFMNISSNETEYDDEDDEEDEDEEFEEKDYYDQKEYMLIFRDQIRIVKKVNYNKPSKNFPGHNVSQSIHKKILVRNAKKYLFY